MVSKIKDGLFLGNAESSSDPEFLELNKISNLVNLSGREIPNVWASHGLVYLTFLWEDRPDFKLFGDTFDGEDGRYPPPLTEIVDFIEDSLRHGVSVLLFSTRGQSRSVVAACAYLMCKYKWGFEKAFELILSKKPDVAPNKGFVQQLFELDRALLKHSGGLRSTNGDLKTCSSAPPGPDGTPVAYLDGFALTLSPNDVLRWKSWDATYLVRRLLVEGTPSSSENLPDRKLSSILCAHNAAEIDESDDDELLIVCSFINSKMASQTFWETAPKTSSHKRRVTFPAGNQLVKILDINTAPTITFSPPGGILKCRTSDSKAGFERASAIRQKSDNTSLNTSPSSAGSNGALSTADLYGFVGMRCEGPSSLRSVEKPKSRSSIHTEKSLTAEQRLLEVVQSMSVRGVSQMRSEMLKHEMAEPKFSEKLGSKLSDVHALARQDKGSEWERPRADGERESKEVETAPSLYDLAYKDIIISAAPRAMFGAKSSGADDDPLAAFSMLQHQGGMIRARHDLGVANVRQQAISNDRGRERGQIKNSRRGGGVCHSKPSILGSPNIKDRKRPSTPSIRTDEYSLASSNASSGVRGSSASLSDSKHGARSTTRGWR